MLFFFEGLWQKLRDIPFASVEFKKNIFNPVVLGNIALGFEFSPLDSDTLSRFQEEEVSEPQAASNRVNISSVEEKSYQRAKLTDQATKQEKKRLQYFEKGNHIASSAHKARTKEAERGWLQSAGYWLTGALGAVAGGILTYAVAHFLGCHRRARQGNILPTTVSPLETTALLLGVADAVNGAYTAYFGSDHLNYPTESLSDSPPVNSELVFDNTQNSEGVEEKFIGKPDSSVLAFPVQENLLLADLLVRNITKEKYVSAIGHYSVEQLHASRIAELERVIMPIFNTTTEEDGSNRYSAEDDTLFSIRNLFAQENDWSIKTKPQKKTKKKTKNIAFTL